MELAAGLHDRHISAMELASDIEWKVSDDPVPYDEALAFMELRARAIREGSARECVWLLEHPPLITAGTSDIPAAEEAAALCGEMGCEVHTVYDVGVAGLHRLFEPLKRLLAAPVDEVASLRLGHGEQVSVTAGDVRATTTGDQLDASADVHLPVGGRLELAIRATEDLSEATFVRLEREQDGTTRLTLDRSHSSVDPSAERAYSGGCVVGLSQRFDPTLSNRTRSFPVPTSKTESETVRTPPTFDSPAWKIRCRPSGVKRGQVMPVARLPSAFVR